MWFEKAGQAMLFPCFEGFFFDSFHKPATTSNIGPPLYVFFWIQTRRATAARDEMWFENASRGPAGPCCFRFVGRLFGGWIVCEIVQNRRKTSMIRPKAGKFFSGFRRDV